MPIRPATDHDIKTLSLHHRLMFEEIWQEKGLKLSKQQAIELEQAYAHKLATELNNNTCRAWIAEDTQKPVASGAITLVSYVPNPSDLSPYVAYLHSMYTEKAHRKQGYAQSIINKILEHCRSNSINRVTLNASNQGKGVYEKIGFHSSHDFMKLYLKKDN